MTTTELGASSYPNVLHSSPFGIEWQGSGIGIVERYAFSEEKEVTIWGSVRRQSAG